MSEEKIQKPKCSQTCGCQGSAQEKPKTIEAKPEEQQVKKKAEPKVEPKVELDPTHFGDWQIGCRTIDF